MSVAFDSQQLSVGWLDSGRKRRRVLLALTVGLLSLVLARLILSFDIFIVAGLVLCSVVVAIAYQPRHGLYLTFLIVLGFEGASGDPLMLPGVYMNESLQQSLHATGAILTPLELLILLCTGLWIAHGLVRRNFDFQAGSLDGPMLLFGMALLFGVGRGLASGAIFNFIFWESRFLFYMVLCYLLSANTIRTRGHVRTLLTLVFVCVTLNAVESAWRRFALADTGLLGPVQETWYAHEDVVVWGLLIMLVLAQRAFGAPTWQRILGPLAVLVTAYAMLASERRAGYIAVMVAFAAMGLVLFFIKRKAFYMLVLPLAICTLVYLPLFWNNTGTLGQPARAVRSLSDPNARDASSDAYRDLEAINVRATIASDPLLGIGFGKPFLQVVTVPDISFFEFWNYEAHHDILWVWMKMGAFGFTAFFIIMCGGIARSVHLARSVRNDEARVFALLTLSAIVMSLVYCYVDIGLAESRIPIVLGVTLGVLGNLDRIYRERAADASTTTQPLSDGSGSYQPHTPGVKLPASLVPLDR